LALRRSRVKDIIELGQRKGSWAEKGAGSKSSRVVEECLGLVRGELQPWCISWPGGLEQAAGGRGDKGRMEEDMIGERSTY